MQLSTLEQLALQAVRHRQILTVLQDKENAAPTEYNRKYKLHGISEPDLQNMFPWLRKQDLTLLFFKGYLTTLNQIYLLTPKGRRYLKNLSPLKK